MRERGQKSKREQQKSDGACVLVHTGGAQDGVSLHVCARGARVRGRGKPCCTRRRRCNCASAVSTQNATAGNSNISPCRVELPTLDAHKHMGTHKHIDARKHMNQTILMHINTLMHTAHPYTQHITKHIDAPKHNRHRRPDQLWQNLHHARTVTHNSRQSCQRQQQHRRRRRRRRRGRRRRRSRGSRWRVGGKRDRRVVRAGNSAARHGRAALSQTRSTPTRRGACNRMHLPPNLQRTRPRPPRPRRPAKAPCHHHLLLLLLLHPACQARRRSRNPQLSSRRSSRGGSHKHRYNFHR